MLHLFQTGVPRKRNAATNVCVRQLKMVSANNTRNGSLSVHVGTSSRMNLRDTVPQATALELTQTTPELTRTTPVTLALGLPLILSLTLTLAMKLTLSTIPTPMMMIPLLWTEGVFLSVFHVGMLSRMDLRATVPQATALELTRTTPVTLALDSTLTLAIKLNLSMILTPMLKLDRGTESVFPSTELKRAVMEHARIPIGVGRL